MPISIGHEKIEHLLSHPGQLQSLMGSTTGRDRFLRAASGRPTSRPPVWMMRQAGRYLPEYRSIRENYTFLEAISTPAIAEEISLQPWERYQPDGVVMYSDILTALEPLGLSYQITPGVGPVIDSPISECTDVADPMRSIDETVGYVGELLERLSTSLNGEAAIVGFVGGPFTLAAYAVEGEPSRSFMKLRRLRYEAPEEFTAILDRIGDVLEAYVKYQVAHGADVIQLFDTYAGLLSTSDFREMLLPIHQRIIRAIDVPSIVYARNMNGRLDLLTSSGADVVGLDWTVPMTNAREKLGDVAVQGNLDPAALYGSPVEIRSRTIELIESAGPSGHIMNLGHGVDRHTPPEKVDAFFSATKSFSWST